MALPTLLLSLLKSCCRYLQLLLLLRILLKHRRHRVNATTDVSAATFADSAAVVVPARAV
jgi:hypothetical protein